MSETRGRESRGHLVPGTRPMRARAVIVGQSSASADESVRAKTAHKKPVKTGER